jgi:hypothetical protein
MRFAQRQIGRDGDEGVFFAFGDDLTKLGRGIKRLFYFCQWVSVESLACQHFRTLRRSRHQATRC